MIALYYVQESTIDGRGGLELHYFEIVSKLNLEGSLGRMENYIDRDFASK
jgi:hypothetical protein